AEEYRSVDTLAAVAVAQADVLQQGGVDGQQLRGPSEGKCFRGGGSRQLRVAGVERVHQGVQIAFRLAEFDLQRLHARLVAPRGSRGKLRVQPREAAPPGNTEPEYSNVNSIFCPARRGDHRTIATTSFPRRASCEPSRA